MKGSICDLVGRSITGVIVKQGSTVAQQVFLLFSDGTYFEFYSRERMSYSGSLQHGGADAVRNYMANTQTIVVDEVWEVSREGAA